MHNQTSKHRCETKSPAPIWTPPPPGTVLVNSDAGNFEVNGKMGAGVVIRDHHGNCLAACRHQLPGLAPPEEAEALALRRAVLLAREEGFGRAIFATDCLSLVHRLNSSLMDRSPVGILVGGIKHMTNSFTMVSFIHVKRSLNEAAHLLAQSCNSVASSEVFHSAPDCIRRTTCIDII